MGASVLSKAEIIYDQFSLVSNSEPITPSAALDAVPCMLQAPRLAKVLVRLSGGVDRAVAAALLLEQGHEVAAGYMKNWINHEGIPGDCPWERAIAPGQIGASYEGGRLLGGGVFESVD